MGGYQNYGPFLGTLNIRGRIILGQKRTIILITTHIQVSTGLSGSMCGALRVRWGLHGYFGVFDLGIQGLKGHDGGIKSAWSDTWGYVRL